MNTRLIDGSRVLMPETTEELRRRWPAASPSMLQRISPASLGSPRILTWSPGRMPVSSIPTRPPHDRPQPTTRRPSPDRDRQGRDLAERNRGRRLPQRQLLSPLPHRGRASGAAPRAFAAPTCCCSPRSPTRLIPASWSSGAATRRGNSSDPPLPGGERRQRRARPPGRRTPRARHAVVAHVSLPPEPFPDRPPMGLPRERPFPARHRNPPGRHRQRRGRALLHPLPQRCPFPHPSGPMDPSRRADPPLAGGGAAQGPPGLFRFGRAGRGRCPFRPHRRLGSPHQPQPRGFISRIMFRAARLATALCVFLLSFPWVQTVSSRRLGWVSGEAHYKHLEPTEEKENMTHSAPTPLVPFTVPGIDAPVHFRTEAIGDGDSMAVSVDIPGTGRSGRASFAGRASAGESTPATSPQIDDRDLRRGMGRVEKSARWKLSPSRPGGCPERSARRVGRERAAPRQPARTARTSPAGAFPVGAGLKKIIEWPTRRCRGTEGHLSGSPRDGLRWRTLPS